MTAHKLSMLIDKLSSSLQFIIALTFITVSKYNINARVIGLEVSGAVFVFLLFSLLL
jgi:hypothetical protein